MWNSKICRRRIWRFRVIRSRGDRPSLGRSSYQQLKLISQTRIEFDKFLHQMRLMCRRLKMSHRAAPAQRDPRSPRRCFRKSRSQPIVLCSKYDANEVQPRQLQGRTVVGFTDSINKKIALGLISFTESLVHFVRWRPPVQWGATALRFFDWLCSDYCDVAGHWPKILKSLHRAKVRYSDHWVPQAHSHRKKP